MSNQIDKAIIDGGTVYSRKIVTLPSFSILNNDVDKHVVFVPSVSEQWVPSVLKKMMLLALEPWALLQVCELLRFKKQQMWTQEIEVPSATSLSCLSILNKAILPMGQCAIW